MTHSKKNTCTSETDHRLAGSATRDETIDIYNFECTDMENGFTPDEIRRKAA